MVHILGVKISISEAKGRLTDLVRRAEAGDEVVLTRHGQPAVRLVPVQNIPTNPEERRAIMDAIRKRAILSKPGPGAARSQDFLYDKKTGLPK